MASDPSIKTLPGGYLLVHGHEMVKLRYSRFAEDRRNQSTSAEVEITSTSPEAAGHLHRGRVVLTGSTSKTQLAKLLYTYDENLDWTNLIEKDCRQVLDLYRVGEPVVDIGDLPDDNGPAYRIDPFIPEGRPAIIYGKGGSFKSYFALALGVIVKSGLPVLGFKPIQGEVLVTDYETSPDEADRRVKAICRGWGLNPVTLAYRHCAMPLSQDIESFQDIVGRLGVSMLIIDSVAAACGGDPSSAELAVQMFGALRQLKVSSLLVDHISKNGSGDTSPFGSVYKINYGRSVWELRRAEGRKQQTIDLALHHRKVNEGPLLGTLGFGVEFTNDEYGRTYTVNITRNNILETDHVKDLPLKDQILSELKSGAATVDALAVALNKEDDEAQITARCNDLKKAGVIVKIGNAWGLVSYNDPWDIEK
jgi:hypothetical protein